MESFPLYLEFFDLKVLGSWWTRVTLGKFKRISKYFDVKIDDYTMKIVTWMR